LACNSRRCGEPAESFWNRHRIDLAVPQLREHRRIHIDSGCERAEARAIKCRERIADRRGGDARGRSCHPLLRHFEQAILEPAHHPRHNRADGVRIGRDVEITIAMLQGIDRKLYGEVGERICMLRVTPHELVEQLGVGNGLGQRHRIDGVAQRCVGHGLVHRSSLNFLSCSSARLRRLRTVRPSTLHIFATTFSLWSIMRRSTTARR
jgi:hypothetical protein